MKVFKRLFSRKSEFEMKCEKALKVFEQKCETSITEFADSLLELFVSMISNKGEIKPVCVAIRLSTYDGRDRDVAIESIRCDHLMSVYYEVDDMIITKRFEDIEKILNRNGVEVSDFTVRHEYVKFTMKKVK